MTSEDRDRSTVDSVDTDEGSRSSSVSTKAGKKEKKQLPLWQEIILLVVIALGLAIVIKAFFVQAFYIPSESMEPGLIKNDRILVEKWSYWGDKEPQRGDVVVFKDPGGWLGGGTAGPSNPIAKAMVKVGLYPAGGHLVKRVIGVEGDTISCCDAKGRISVNGTPRNEDSYLAKQEGRPCNGPMIGCRWTAGPVPKDHIFVMGDNRGRSADSTVHLCTKARTEATGAECVPGEEFVSNDLVVGKVFVLIWPFSRFDWIGRPDSFADVPDAS